MRGMRGVRTAAGRSACGGMKFGGTAGSIGISCTIGSMNSEGFCWIWRIVRSSETFGINACRHEEGRRAGLVVQGEAVGGSRKETRAPAGQEDEQEVALALAVREIEGGLAREETVLVRNRVTRENDARAAGKPLRGRVRGGDDERFVETLAEARRGRHGHRHGGLSDGEDGHALGREDELAAGRRGDGADVDSVAAAPEGLGDECGRIHGGDGGAVEPRQDLAVVQGARSLAKPARSGGLNSIEGRLVMARSRMDDILGTVKDAGDRSQEIAAQVAARVEDVLDEAGVQGKRIRRELSRRLKQVDRVGRDNAFVMAFGALAVGVLIGYLVARDDD